MQIKPEITRYVKGVVRLLTQQTRTKFDDNISVRLSRATSETTVNHPTKTIRLNPERLEVFKKLPSAIPALIAHEISHLLKDNKDSPKFIPETEYGEEQFKRFEIKTSLVFNASQKIEIVADIMGARLAQRTGFPNALEGMVSMLKNVKNAKLGCSIHNTHPCVNDRITMLQQNLADPKVVRKIDDYLDS